MEKDYIYISHQMRIQCVFVTKNNFFVDLVCLQFILFKSLCDHLITPHTGNFWMLANQTKVHYTEARIIFSCVNSMK